MGKKKDVFDKTKKGGVKKSVSFDNLKEVKIWTPHLFLKVESIMSTHFTGT